MRTPRQDNRCHDCGGRIVQKARGLFHGQFEFSPPECERCGRTYLFARHALRVGIEEFMMMMRQPMTH